jgi:hypothetical protein
VIAMLVRAVVREIEAAVFWWLVLRLLRAVGAA